MISSTYYDLRQVRADLIAFLEKEMGYTPIASELNSFPVDPDANTVQNCTRRVENEADVLILIIGGRFGYVEPESSRSVTNLEYLAARAKRIPIFAFIEPSLLPLVPVWKANPEADLSSSVQDPRVLGFLEEVRDKDKVWAREFSSAKDIIEALRASFAHLSRQGLEWSRKLQGLSPDAEFLSTLDGRSLRLVLERPQSWEVRFLFEEVTKGLRTVDEDTEDHRLGIVFGEADHISLGDMAPWVSSRMNEIQRLVDVMNTLFGGPLQDAIGAGNQASEPRKIAYVARRIVRTYTEFIGWWARVRRAAVDDELLGVRDELAKLADKVLQNIRNWAFDGKRAVEDAIKAAVDAHLELILVLEIQDDGEAVNRELQKLERLFD